MKIAVNCDWGCFFMPEAFRKEFPNMEYDYTLENFRVHPALIQWIEEHPQEMEGTDIEIREIPSNATDFLINEYDGIETILYVVNGKIYVE